jgi:hypothetical protein
VEPLTLRAGAGGLAVSTRHTRLPGVIRLRAALSAPVSVARLRLFVLVAALLATGLKIYLAAITRGTDDVYLFGVFAGWVREYGPIGIYGAPPDPDIAAPYNHPPLSGMMLMLFNWLVDHGARFETLIRLPATLSDFVAALLLFELIRTRRPAVEAAVGAALFVWSPALGVISGFHGNTDPVCIMFTLLAVYLLVIRDAPVLAGVSYALGLSIKLVPIVAGPILLFIAWRAGRAHAARFVGAGAVVMAVIWGPALVTHYDAVKTNVIGYAGFGPKQWGISQFIEWMGLPQGLVDAYAGPGRFLVLLVSAGLPVFLAWRRPSFTLPAVGLTFALFLLFTPVHAMQYLVWPIAGLYLMNVWSATVYSFAAGALILKVYSRWNCSPRSANPTCGDRGHAWPWHWDQAWSTGMGPGERKVAAIVWLVLLASIVVGMLPWFRRADTDDGGSAGPAPNDNVGASVSPAVQT